MQQEPCYFDTPRGTYQWLKRNNFNDSDAYEAVVQMTRDGLFGQEEKDRQLALDIDKEYKYVLVTSLCMKRKDTV